METVVINREGFDGSTGARAHMLGLLTTLCVELNVLSTPPHGSDDQNREF
jgi:hypothetical protein